MLVTTFLLTVVFELVVAIGVGMLLVCILFVKRMTDETGVRAWVDADHMETESGVEVPAFTRVYKQDGPLFFSVADKSTRNLYMTDCKCTILRMRSVNSIDLTALNALEQICVGCSMWGITMVLSHLNTQPEAMLNKAGFLQKIGADNCCEHLGSALQRAREIVGE